MFDVGFSEILLIFVLALVVLGPEKLPRVAAQVGRWIGRARGMARQFREQLEEEVSLEEARRLRPPAPPKPSEPATVAPPAPAVSTTTHAEQPTQTAEPNTDPRQQDWVGGQDWVNGVSAAPKPPQGSVDGAYAPPHERGT